ncbi:metallopeptidase family protein [Mesoterricola silvestris]|nr:metallopeptidase family protein [Mesoterricola silvestris]
MTRRRFEYVVARALEAIPEAFKPYLEGLPVVVEDEPSVELLETLGVPPGETLLGLFSGPAVGEEMQGSVLLPARITVFRLPHLADAENVLELEREVARTVLHEVAHRFGIGEERLEDLGLG